MLKRRTYPFAAIRDRLDPCRFEVLCKGKTGMYAPKESEPRQTPRPAAGARGGAATADARGAVPRGDGGPLSRIGQLADVGLAEILGWLRAGLGWIIAAVAACLIAALLYAMVTPPRYTVFTDILIDPSNLNVVRDDVFTTNPQRDAQLLEVESKLRVLTSRNVLSRVIDKLDLTHDSEFVKPGLFAPLTGLFSGARSGGGDTKLAVMRELSERVEARREERSFVVVMRFWAQDPDKAVTISNAIVDAFEEELFQSAAESAGRVVRNLNNRLDELRRNVTEAEQKVEDYRRSKGLQIANGEPVSARLSGEIDTQVLAAQQRLIESEARHAQMSAAIAQRRAASATVFDSPTMNTLRAQYNTLQQQIGSIRATFGSRHPQLLTALSEQQVVESSLQREARRILDIAKGDLERDRASLSMLRAKAAAERSKVFTDNEEQVQLRDLQRDARAKATLYETHLARTQQIGERQQIDTTNVRVISRPLPPKAKSWPPRTVILLGIAAVLGLCLGIGLALMRGAWRHLRDPRPASA
jgi:succinoglycan biosynthesis transport protein ExoP